jgi:hypothetical protein
MGGRAVEGTGLEMRGKPSRRVCLTTVPHRPAWVSAALDPFPSRWVRCRFAEFGGKSGGKKSAGSTNHRLDAGNDAAADPHREVRVISSLLAEQQIAPAAVIGVQLGEDRFEQLELIAQRR